MNFVDLKTQYERIQEDVQARIQAVLTHGRYVMGPEISELEERLAAMIGVRHAVAVASGTDALLIALMALEVGAGDEVITTPFTFIATAEVIALLGARPVFVDIDPRTYNLDPAGIAAALSPRTRAILPVSLYGQCADLDAINAIAARAGLPVIEDAAQSLGATYKGRHSGALTTVGCTSFFPSKPLGAYGDGGACFTDDDHLALAMRQIRDHGQDRRYHHIRLGLNGRLDSIQAAVLLAKLAIFPDEVATRARRGARYTELLAAVTGITTPFIEPHNTSVFAQYTVHLADRERVAARLGEQGIPTAVHYPIPLNLQPAFAGMSPPAGALPVAEGAASGVLSLPMHPYLQDAEQRQVAEALRQALEA
jgi:UDP-2-acetamido-2-deoxy-ribo-hexuluronate aminotransferase